MTEEAKKYVYKSTLRTFYGLTDRLIEQIGAPDKQITNPHYKCAAPANLYRIDRVEMWVDAHRAELAVVADRRRKLSEKRNTKTQEVLPAARAEAQAVVTWAGIAHIELTYNPLIWRYRNIDEWAKNYYTEVYGPETTVGRNEVIAFIRHNLTNYEKLLNRLEKSLRKAKNIVRNHPEIGETYEHAYQIIRSRVNAEIDRLLPESVQ